MLYPGKLRRRKSPEYKAWIAVASLQLRRVNFAIQGPVSIAIEIGRCNANRDLDNMNKAPIDLIKALGWIKDDNVKHVVRVVTSYLPDIVPDGEMVITVTGRGE
jgi:Holliday junction resolvase RusA-like endonuclease